MPILSYVQHNRTPQPATFLVGDRQRPAGVALAYWVRARAEHGAQAELTRAAGQWLELVRTLATSTATQVFQPDKVLVDGDGRFAWTGNATEGLDHFAALAVYVALRALAAQPQVGALLVPTVDEGWLLFQAKDFRDPDHSAARRHLLQSPDAQVRDLTHFLFQLGSGDSKSVPPIDEVLLWCESLSDLLDRRDYDRATQLVPRMGAEEVIDVRLVPRIDEAFRRVASRQALEAALASGDLREIERRVSAAELTDYPAAASLVDRARRELRRACLLDVLAAARTSQRWSIFRAVWTEHGAELESSTGARVHRDAFQRLASVDQLEALLDAPDADTEFVQRQWDVLYPQAEPTLAERLVAARDRRTVRDQRLERVLQLIEASKSPTFKSDRELHQAWKSARREGESRLDAWHAHYQAAKRRMRRLRWLNQLTKSPTAAGEQQIAACARYLPPDYHPNLPMRIQLAQQRLAALRALLVASVEPASDLALAHAWANLGQVHGQMLVPTEAQERIAMALQRTAILEALRPWNTWTPVERDRRVLQLWDEKLLVSCRDARELRPMWDEARSRSQLIAQLGDAAQADDGEAVARLMAAPCLADYPLPAEVLSALEQFRQRTRQARDERRRALLQTILDIEPRRFRELFDRVLVRELCAELPHRQRVVSRWTEEQILPLAHSGLARGDGDGCQRVDGLACRARWTWPAEHVADRCQVTISSERPRPNAVPEDLPLLHTQVVDRHNPQDVAPVIELPAPPEWGAAHVYVWAIVDLGFQTFYCEPLELGTLNPVDTNPMRNGETR